MLFALRFAWRDSRASRRRLLFSSAAIMLGVAALVAIGSLGDNLRRAIDQQARSLLGADLALTSRGGWTPEIDAALAPLLVPVPAGGPGGEAARETMFSSMVAFPASEGRTRLATLRAIDLPYPFYGDILAEPAGFAGLLADGRHVLVEQALLAQFGARIGDPLRLGAKTFVIAGALRQIPGETMSAATLSPRVVVARSALEGTGLLGPGAIVRHRAWYKFPPATDIAELVRLHEPAWQELRLRAETVSSRQRQLGRAIGNIHAFLSLTGFISLFLGAIGVAGAIHVHISRKLSTVAILRCLGAGSRQCFAAYLAQGAALGVFGSALGAALGIAVQRVLPASLHTMLPVDVAFFISWPAVARGFFAGLGICLLFALLPLLAVRRVPPLRALRSAWEPAASSRPDPLRIAVYALIAASVLGFAFWQTGRWTHAFAFSGGLAAGLGVLAGLARLLMLAARRINSRRLPYAWRQGVSNLYRPHNRTLLLILTLGLGSGLLLLLGLARATLINQLRVEGGNGRPNLMFFDVQDDQEETLLRLLGEHHAEVRASSPIVTMRLAEIKGRPVADILRDPDLDLPRWTLRREYRASYRAALNESEKLAAGEFVPRVAADASPVPISLETGLAHDMRLALGDELVFDVQGLPLKTRVASLREVEWRQLMPNFFVLFPEGVLEDAPKFHLVAVRVTSSEHSARVQQAVTQALPNVSAIDLEMILQSLDGVFSRIEFVIHFLALFTLGTGILVLAGAILASHGQRSREIVLLRTLGASSRQLAGILVFEYAALGLLGALTGAILAVAANTVLARELFDSPPACPPALLFGVIAAVTLLAVITGLASSRGLMRQPPLAALRREQ